MNDTTLQVCEMVGEQLVKKNKFEEAIKIYTLLIKRGQHPRYYIQRANCYKSLRKYVEAARDLTEASTIGPHIYASLSGVQYYDQIEHYY